MGRWRDGRTRRAPSILVSETKAVMVAANDDNNNAAGWLISNAHTLPPSLPPSFFLCVSPRIHDVGFSKREYGGER